ncbi:MAG: cell division protein FtsA [Armatimonadetes bacterium]|nr:cell division protein FtsA [Armatimonadota bacterium]
MEVLTALDIGTSKISCIIAEADAEGNMDVVGHGVSPCLGLRKGALVDPEQTVHAIETAVSEAEKEAGYTINSVHLCLSSEYLSSLPSQGVWAVSNPENEISAIDVRRVVEAARMVGIPSDREILHIVPRGFTVDGQNGIRNPVGLTGLRLEVETHVVAAASSFLQNICKCVQKANLEIDADGLVASTIASGLAVLTDEERKLGTAMIDIGAGTVDLAVYCDEEIGHSAVLPVAGDLLTHDLARFFRIPPSQAERLKLDKGLVSPDYLESSEDDLHDETIEVTSLSGEELVPVSRHQLAEVLEARLLDIFEWVAEECKKAERRGLVVASLVMTGGTSQLPGLARLARRELEMPVRVAAACYPQGLPEQLGSPIYATGVGLLLYAAARRFTPEEKEEGPSRMKVLLGRVGRWLAEVF